MNRVAVWPTLQPGSSNSKVLSLLQQLRGQLYVGYICFKVELYSIQSCGPSAPQHSTWWRRKVRLINLSIVREKIPVTCTSCISIYLRIHRVHQQLVACLVCHTSLYYLQQFTFCPQNFVTVLHMYNIYICCIKQFFTVAYYSLFLNAISSFFYRDYSG